MPKELLFTIAAFDLTGLVLFGVVLWRPWDGRRVGCWGDCLAFVLYGLVLGVAAIAVGRMFSLHPGFAALRFLAHAVFCVWAPLLLIRGAWRIRTGSRAFGGLLLSLALCLEAAYVYAREIEPFWLEVTHYEIETPRIPAAAQPLRIAVLADLQSEHIGPYEREVFAALDSLRPDLILLPGDYLQVLGSYADRERERLALVELFNALQHRPRYGIFGVDGDCDDAAEVFAGSVAQPLRDENRILEGPVPLQLIGLSRPASRRPPSPAQRASLADFAGFSIVMGHAPDFAGTAIRDAEGRHDRPGPGTTTLFVAGHTHGGQVVLPFLGPPITLTRIPRRYASGLHELGATTLFVSRGVGHERGLAPRIRFNCRPELALITLRGTGDD